MGDNRKIGGLRVLGQSERLSFLNLSPAFPGSFDNSSLVASDESDKFVQFLLGKDR